MAPRPITLTRKERYEEVWSQPKKTSASRGAVGTRRRPPRLTHFEPYAVGPTGREALSRVSHEGPGQGRAVVYSSGISRRA